MGEGCASMLGGWEGGIRKSVDEDEWERERGGKEHTIAAHKANSCVGNVLWHQASPSPSVSQRARRRHIPSSQMALSFTP